MKSTETRNGKTRHIDKMNTLEILNVIQKENYNAVKSLDKALIQISKACDVIVANMEKGGRLFYVGAGTSGRLGVVDAAECPPTFGVSSDTVIGIIAGGRKSMFEASEGAEDDACAAIKDLQEYNLRKEDTLVGISASGNASYVLSAVEYAKSLGAQTIGLTCNYHCKLETAADIAIVTETGAEVITGSTRMKAGTAQKLVLNMLSTCAMVKTGKVYENLMINLKPTNIKLKKRMLSIVDEILHCGTETAERLLNENGWNIRQVVEKSQK